MASGNRVKGGRGGGAWAWAALIVGTAGACSIDARDVRVADTGSAFPGVSPGAAGASSAESGANGVLPSTPRMGSGSARDLPPLAAIVAFPVARRKGLLHRHAADMRRDGLPAAKDVRQRPLFARITINDRVCGSPADSAGQGAPACTSGQHRL